MKSSCSCRHVSYTTWRLQTLRNLYHDTKQTSTPRLSFLWPSSVVETESRPIRTFHTSPVKERKNIKDLKRTAKHQAVQLELAKHTRHGVEVDEQNGQSIQQQRQGGKDTWTPFAKDSLEELKDLLVDLRTLTKESAEKSAREENEGVPFEHGSRILRRKNPNQPESPLEHKLRWEHDKKLQVHEVEVDKRLENNVWAQMLASPMRMDRGTKARLPRDFMTTFGVVRNPKDEKDYMLPLELFDLEALKRQLQSQDNNTEIDDTIDTPKAYSHDPDRPQAGTRIFVQPVRTNIQAMTEEFIYKTNKGELATSPERTNSSKLSAGLVPQRWRHKQGEAEAFQKTRRNFNQVLERQPDADEPDLTQAPKLGKLLWQPDLPVRMEKIMRERIAMVFDAVGSHNTSGRAIRGRRILAVDVPENGQFQLDDRGRLLSANDFQRLNENKLEQTDAVGTTLPDWIHGAIFLHIGKADEYRTTIEHWHSLHVTQYQRGQSKLELLPQDPLIPPMITINHQIRLPVFNLETLFSKDHADKITKSLETHKIFSLEFWRNKTQHDSPDSNDESSVEINESPIIPTTLSNAGEQVLSSILTPNNDINTPPSPQSLQPPPPDHNTNTDSPIPEPEPYLLLIKPKTKHSSTLVKEIWQLWRYIGGREGLYFD